MKRKLAFLILTAMCAAAVTAGCGGSGAALEYALNAEETAYTVVSIGECDDREIVIPGSYEGKPVTAIGIAAFYNSGVVSVTIPASVTFIGGDAFRGCSALTAVKFENPNGWKVSKHSDMSAAQAVGDLSDPGTAAKYLTTDYWYYCWAQSAE